MHERLVPLFFPDGAPADIDPSDVEKSAAAALSAAAATADDGPGAGLRSEVAARLLTGEPPELEEAAVRMLEAGHAPPDVWRDLELALLDAFIGEDEQDRQQATRRIVSGSTPEAERRLLTNLELLPFPQGLVVSNTYLELAAQPIPLDELDGLVASRLGLDDDVPLVRRHLESVQDELILDQGLVLFGDDVAVDPEQILYGIVLTTRLGRRRDRLVLDADLAAFSYLAEPDQTADELPLDVAPDFERRTVWYGPEDWLAEFAEGDLIQVWVDEGEVHIDRVRQGRASLEGHGDLVRLLRERFDAETAESGLPLSARELVVVLRAADPSAFATPAPPFTELCRAAGLEVREDWVAADARQWARHRWTGLIHRIFDEFGDEEQKRIGPLVDLQGRLIEGEEPDTGQIRAALAALADPSFTLDLLRLLFGADEDPEATAEVARLADVLRSSANRAWQRAAVAWLDARVAARQGDPLRAEARLRDVLADDPDNADVMDELAWYRSDRGDAEGARSLWRQLEDPPAGDLEMLPEPGGEGPKLRRNEPCWCGSGRKYKACHLRVADRPPLPERFAWLLQKPVSFLGRRGGLAVIQMAEAAVILADGDREAMADAWTDPLVVDVVLTEFGWLQRFLDERGALLPDDERLLVTSWLLAERTLLEVLDADGTTGLVHVRDLRTGDEHEVVDRMFAASARRSQLVCSRLLDDGERKRLGVGILEVRPGREGGLLELLDLEDPRERGEAVLQWAAAALAPPRLQTREGEPLTFCEARLGPVDPDEAALAFDEIFERGTSDDQWFEHHELASGEEILRGTITLEGAEVVVAANSEARADRLIAQVLDEFPEAAVLTAERRPIPAGGPGPMPAPSAATTGAETSPSALSALEHVIDQQELRWCDENVPALDGLTPRQAAADPTRREQLERLLLSMPEGGVSPLGFAAMRPARLRQLLGLD